MGFAQGSDILGYIVETIPSYRALDTMAATRSWIETNAGWASGNVVIAKVRTAESPIYDSENNRFIDQSGTEVGVAEVLKNKHFDINSFTEDEALEVQDLISRIDELTPEEKARLQELYEEGVTVPVVIPSPLPPIYPAPAVPTVAPIPKKCLSGKTLPDICKWFDEDTLPEKCKC